MKPEDLLAVAVRAIGLVWLLFGLGYALDALLLKLGYFDQPDPSVAYYLIVGLFQVVLGLCLLRGAPVLVDFVYPWQEEDANDVETEEKP